MDRTSTDVPRSGVSRGLLALNGVLAAALGTGLVMSHSAAQPTAARPRGEYTMISGKPQGQTINQIYILDSVNQELVALRWDQSRRVLAVVAHRSLTQDRAMPGPR